MPDPYEQGHPVRLMQCIVTSTSPLEVTIFGQTAVPASGVDGLVYTLGVARALVAPFGKPIVFPID